MSYGDLAKLRFGAAQDRRTPGVVDPDEVEAILEVAKADLAQATQDPTERSCELGDLGKLAMMPLPGAAKDAFSAIDPRALGRLKVFLEGENPLARNLVTPELAPYLERVDRDGQVKVKEYGKDLASAFELGPSFAAYGDEVLETGVPACLTRRSPPPADLFFDFSTTPQGGGQFGGTGAQLGNGFVLTAFHVVQAQIPPARLPEDQVFGPAAPAESGGRWEVRALPKRGTFALGADNRIAAGRDRSAFNDFALVHAKAGAASRGFAEIRKTSDLAPGERVWVIGDKTGGKLRVSTGVFGGLRDGQGVLDNIAVEEGFSGSPAVDAQGRLVGIVYAMNDAREAFLMPTDRLVPFLDHAREALPELPAPALVGFSGAPASAAKTPP